jgi:hypothetical protein
MYSPTMRALARSGLIGSASQDAWTFSRGSLKPLNRFTRAENKPARTNFICPEQMGNFL